MRDVNRRQVATIVVVAVALSALGGWIAASRIRSPAEIAAQTAAPSPSPILVPAEERTVAATVVTRGTGRFGTPQTLTTSPSALKPSPGIVTNVPAPGTEIAEGGVVMTATGRPVFLLAGDRLGIRDLGPGLQGEDVRQLEQALAQLGFGPGPVDGTYDAGTEGAVARWYEAAGYAPFRATEDQLATIRSRESDLAAARVELAGAADNAATADGDLAAAQAAHADALATQAASPAAVAAAQAQATADNQAAQAEVTARSAALDELLATPDSTPSAIAAARADLASAQASVESVRLAGENAVADAHTAAVQADDAVAATDAAVRTAQQRVTIAQSAIGARGAVADLAGQEANLERRKAGVQVPADEVVFVPRVPVRVSELLVQPGDKLEGSVMKATDAVVAIDGSLALADASLVHPGMPVSIDEPDLGISATGTISQMAQTPGTNGVDGFHIWFEVIVDGSPPNLVGVSLRLTVAVESSQGQVLAVPTSALSLAADGTSRVQRDDGHGHTTSVQVQPGLTAAGYVQVTPLQGTLRPGDLVVVGVQGGGSGRGRGGETTTTGSPGSSPTTGPTGATGASGSPTTAGTTGGRPGG
jgi:peptidoglycan hydrolase-like protein with peptidoglycan-binding domain